MTIRMVDSHSISYSLVYYPVVTISLVRGHETGKSTHKKQNRRVVNVVKEEVPRSIDLVLTNMCQPPRVDKVHVQGRDHTPPSRHHQSPPRQYFHHQEHMCRSKGITPKLLRLTLLFQAPLKSSQIRKRPENMHVDFLNTQTIPARKDNMLLKERTPAPDQMRQGINTPPFPRPGSRPVRRRLRRRRRIRRGPGS